MEVKNLENASCFILHSHETNAMFIYTEGGYMLEALVTYPRQGEDNQLIFHASI